MKTFAYFLLICSTPAFAGLAEGIDGSIDWLTNILASLAILGFVAGCVLWALNKPEGTEWCIKATIASGLGAAARPIIETFQSYFS